MSAELRRAVEASLEAIMAAAAQEIRDQGHVATGRGVKSLEKRVREAGSVIIGDVLIESYMNYVDSGTRPHRPPYGPIRRWAQAVKPGANSKELDSFAWAVVKKIEKEGTPTGGSFRFSNNGRRKNWSKFAISASENRFESIMEDEGWIRKALDNVIEESRKRR